LEKLYYLYVLIIFLKIKYMCTRTKFMWVAVISFLCATFLLSSCEEDIDEPVIVNLVKLNTGRIILFPGDTARLIATITPGDATDKTITWVSNEPGIADVDSTGKVTAYTPGVATVVVKGGNGLRMDWCIVNVQGRVIDSGGDAGTWMWKFTEDGILTISGTGGIQDYASGGTPWEQHKAAIKTLKLSDGIINIGDYAFDGCVNLNSEIAIPAGVTRIGNSAFRNCAAITKVTILKDVATIEDNAFADCTALKDVHINVKAPPTPTLGANNFNGNEDDVLTVIRKDSVILKAYRDAPEWAGVFKEIKLP
jgi:hypothetical protein